LSWRESLPWGKGGESEREGEKSQIEQSLRAYHSRRQRKKKHWSKRRRNEGRGGAKKKKK